MCVYDIFFVSFLVVCLFRCCFLLVVFCLVCVFGMVSSSSSFFLLFFLLFFGGGEVLFCVDLGFLYCLIVFRFSFRMG